MKTRKLNRWLSIAAMMMAALPGLAALRVTSPGLNNDHGADAAVLGAEVYVVGSLFGGAANRHDLYVARYAAPGLLVWRRRVQVGLGTIDHAKRVVVSGNFLYVIGTVDFRAGNKNDILIQCYNKNTSALLAQYIYNGTGNDEDTPADVAFSPAGELFVLGTTTSAGTGQDMVMFRCTPVLGAVTYQTFDLGLGQDDVAADMDLWGPTLHVIGTSENAVADTDMSYLLCDTATGMFAFQGLIDFGLTDTGVAIATDVTGAYITGNVETPADLTDIGIIRRPFAGVPAFMLFHRFAGPYEDVASDIEAANWNWIWVTGSSQTPANGYDYSVISPTQNLAALFAFNSYNGPGNGDDMSLQLEIDPATGVFVTGNSQGIGTSTNYTTLNMSMGLVGNWANGYDFAAMVDKPVHMTLAPNGLYVCGTSEAAGSGQDMAFQRLNLVTGADLW